MARNIELKARSADLPGVAAAAQGLSGVAPQTESQRDTYFDAPHGRLKLRERSEDGRVLPTQLIWYERPDASQARGSDYTLFQTADGAILRTLLTGALGVSIEVRKRRTVYIHDNVRIHLDEVDGLGTFIELEAIVDASCNDTQAHAKVRRLRSALGIRDADILSVSYADLLQSAGQ